MSAGASSSMAAAGAQPSAPGHLGAHVVQFYESESFLVDSVGSFIAAGLLAGEAAIVIATPEHGAGFDHALAAAGVDVGLARREGRYVSLDAEATLAQFAIGDDVDRDRFLGLLGDAIDRLAAGGRPVRAFGEMVALLWERGAVPAAIRLEELWNELAETRSFSLLCGYPISSSADPAEAERFADVCARHSSVIPAESYTGLSEEDRLRHVSLLQHRTATERGRREQLEREQLGLEEALERLRELDRLRNEFVAMVVHDIRTPNAVVTGFLSLLQENWAQLPAERIDELLSRAMESTSHISGLVNDMLTAARIDSGEFSFRLAAFDLAEVVYRTVGPARDTNPTTRFEISVPADLPSAYGDADRQHQILNNLLSNAVKFSPPGTTVKVAVEQREDLLVVSVHDEGPGISAQDRGKLFRRFSRLETRSHAKGTGLGLFISKALVEGQGGTIWLDSSPGHGSTFTYTIPVARR